MLPLNIAAESIASKEDDLIANHQVDVQIDRKTTDKHLNGFHPVKPRQPGPNLWTIMQKWVLALPATTEDERARRVKLQGELEWIVDELDDGENSVCAISLFLSCCSRI